MPRRQICQEPREISLASEPLPSAATGDDMGSNEDLRTNPYSVGGSTKKRGAKERSLKIQLLEKCTESFIPRMAGPFSIFLAEDDSN